MSYKKSENVHSLWIFSDHVRKQKKTKQLLFEEEFEWNPIISVGQIRKLTWHGFKSSTIIERIGFFFSCLSIIPLFLFLGFCFSIVAILWFIGILFSPLLNFFITNPEIAERKKEFKKYDMFDINDEGEHLEPKDTEYDILLLSSVLMGVQGKLREYAVANDIYHIGIGFRGKNNGDIFVFDLFVRDGFKNAVVPNFDIGVSFFPPQFSHHVKFANDVDVAVYKTVLDYWENKDVVGSCPASAIRMLISWAQNYQRKIRYNLTGVVALSGEESDKEEVLVAPATCVDFVDQAFFLIDSFMGTELDKDILKKKRCADIFYQIEKPSDFQILEYQTPRVSTFFETFANDIKSGLLESNSNEMVSQTFMNVMGKMAERFPIFYWYCEDNSGQSLYQVIHPKLTLRTRKWKLFCDKTQ